LPIQNSPGEVLAQPASSSPVVPQAGTRPVSLAQVKPGIYRPEVDLFRFVGFLAVFYGHMHPAPSETFRFLAAWPKLQYIFVTLNYMVSSAVPGFFLLSAFVITSLLMRERERRNTIDIRKFYVRRILRIWPIYIAALIVGFAVAWHYHHSTRPNMLIAGIFMVGNFVGPLHLTDYRPLHVLHLWSVSVEEQFYLFFPWAARSFSRRGLQALCLAIIGFGMVSLLFANGKNLDLTWMSSAPNFIFFAGGTLIALRFPAGKLPHYSTRTRVLLCTFGFLATFATHLRTDVGLHGSALPIWVFPVDYAVRLVGLSALLLSLLGTQARIPRVVLYLGQISFGLYVYHVWAIALAVRMTRGMHFNGIAALLFRDGLALALTTLMAIISFHYFEAPFLKLKDKKFTIVRSRPTPATGV
jgi:peptidoglycan/LPS O-acetylase OafA/YrhL